jgi:uncharacterized protein (TIGR01777 family)
VTVRLIEPVEQQPVELEITAAVADPIDRKKSPDAAPPRDTHKFVRHTRIAASAEAVFAWHERPGAFERLTPAWENVKVLEHVGGIRDGARVVVQVQPFWPVKLRWELTHTDYEAGHQFVDRQVSGPFAFWRHTHRIEPDGPHACVLEDCIEYALPGGYLGSAVGRPLVEAKLDRLFRYRHEVTKADLEATSRHGRMNTMRVLVSGSTGLVGSALCTALSTGGNEIARLVRNSPRSRQPEITWNPAGGTIDGAQLEGFDAVVHLAGENIAGGRWTDKQKQKILNSRVQGTRLLCETLAKLKNKPKVLVCASAIGYYGDRGDRWVDETSPAGDDMFLVDVCKEWEAATEPARQAGIRVVNLRFGVILSRDGGALAKMLLPFQLGAGGVLGSGEQYMSWIALDDAVGAIEHCLTDEELNGPVNAVTPNPVTNREYTKTLGKVLYRPTIFPMPAFAARLAFGQMADELLLASTRVAPKQLEASGYKFRYPQLEPALRHVLGK